MYSIIYLYPTGIKENGVSLKNAELYMSVRSQTQKGPEWEGKWLVALQNLFIREQL